MIVLFDFLKKKIHVCAFSLVFLFCFFLLYFLFGVGSARWPDVSPQSGVAHGFSLMPVSGVGVVVDGVKTGGKRDLRNIQERHDQRRNDFFRHTEYRQALEPNV